MAAVVEHLDAVRTLDLPDLPASALVAFDTETSGLHPDDGARVSVVSIAYRMGTVIHTHAWAFDQGPVPGKPGLVKNADTHVPDNRPPIEYQALMKWLAKRRLAAHNAKFDIRITDTGLRGGAGGYKVPAHTGAIDLRDSIVWDTQIGQWILDPTFSTALKSTAARLWGDNEADEQRIVKEALKTNKRYGVGLTQRYDLIDWALIRKYAAKDTELTFRLAEEQIARFEGEDSMLARFFHAEMAVMLALSRMERRGIAYNPEISRAGAVQLQAHLDLLVAELPFKHTTPAAKAWFYDTEGAMGHCFTDSGDRGLSECCVRELAKRPDEVGQVARLFATANKIKNSISKYYLGFANKIGEDGRLRTDFRQAGTVTMRFSSSRINLQALPHDYRLEALPDDVIKPRACFQASPGSELWDFDLAQAEYRVAGKMANCKRIIDYVRDGKDAHSETAMLIFNDADQEHRQIAKRGNFSLLFSIGPRTFAQDLDKQSGIKWSEGKAREFIDQWRDLHPEIPRANKKAERILMQRQRTVGAGYVKLIDGRIRWFDWNEHSYKAFNAVVQGSIAQFVKQWLLAVDQKYPDMLVLTVHDSLVLDIPKDRVAEVVAGVVALGEAMGTALFDIPMGVDAKQWMTAS